MAPNSNDSKGSGKPLRQLAAEKLHGKGANPTLLGDPVSLKAENTDSNPSPRGESVDFPKSVRKVPESSGGSHEEKMLRGEGPKGHHVRGMMTDEIRQGKDARRGRVGKSEHNQLEGDPTTVEGERVAGDATKAKQSKL
ncbi:hypothetical protein QBC42DRAFT_46874 [Cladorrhinum samala]|uniref:Uncharacterized protein n=1 Tax=Cladorrhinum samala TaxID=585594 RepID=A0AAV9H8F8_9PEZI|nr:hypothetical protein QBC42DRAFT_46874 [Cladorrhinum samala]